MLDCFQDYLDERLLRFCMDLQGHKHEGYLGLPNIGSSKSPGSPVVRSIIPEVSAREALVHIGSQESDIVMWTLYLTGSASVLL